MTLPNAKQTLVALAAVFALLIGFAASAGAQERTLLGIFEPAVGSTCTLDPLNNSSTYPDIIENDVVVELGNVLVVDNGGVEIRYDVERVEGHEILSPSFVVLGKIVVEVEWFTHTSLESVDLLCASPPQDTPTATTTTTTTPTTTTTIPPTTEQPSVAAECVADDCPQLAYTGFGSWTLIAGLTALIMIMLGGVARYAGKLD